MDSTMRLTMGRAGVAILRTALLTVLLVSGVVWRAGAQDHSYVLRAGANRVLLGSGDDSGPFHYASLSRRLHARAALTVTVGRVSSTDLDFSPDRPFAWRYREHVLGDLSLRVDPLRFEEGERFEHRLGLTVGVSLRHRDEERPRSLWYPVLMEETIERGDLERLISGADAFHIFKGEDGLYGLETFKESGTELGGLLTLHYAVYIPRLVLAFEAGYRSYREGTPMFDYGVSLGVRL